MIQELTFDEVNAVSGAGEIGDAIRAVGEVGEKIVATAYNAGYMLGSAVRGLFT
jgi:creatinine amidohydrolase/Fe(II)-dependent formamide hydrolase-like protein